MVSLSSIVFEQRKFQVAVLILILEFIFLSIPCVVRVSDNFFIHCFVGYQGFISCFSSRIRPQFHVFPFISCHTIRIGRIGDRTEHRPSNERENSCSWRSHIETKSIVRGIISLLVISRLDQPAAILWVGGIIISLNFSIHITAAVVSR